MSDANERKANRLIDETSPYLLQHAYNPVNWYPWSEEALETARREDKPVLLSVGYSACHWCHVMEHESFEDDAIAALMNEHFVCIKVDREERPDIDKIYQLAHQMLSRRPGGWPLTVFLTPHGHAPIFAGTYFPNQPRHGMPGFGDILSQIAAHFDEHRDDFGEHDASMRETFRRLAEGEHDPAEPDATLLDQAAAELARSFDQVNGGFGSAPKFPHPTNLEVLLRVWERNRSDASMNMFTTTLNAMARGGLFDQLGGGFCRYCVDADWTIPHFEKMLYDNGQLLSLYADAHSLIPDAGYDEIVEQAAKWVIGEMQDPAGGYYSTLDADSEGEEGKFYVFSNDEIAATVPDAALPVMSAHYGLGSTPNFEGKWHLNVAKPLAECARELDISVTDAASNLLAGRQALLALRSTRIRPGLDDKILSSWNALMIRGMARAARVMNRRDWANSAQAALDFVRTTLWQDGRLLATTRDGKTHLNAYLDDYVLLIDAVIELNRTRWRDGDLDFAVTLADRLLDAFIDEQRGGFFFTSSDHEKLLQRPKPTMDDAVPSGNGIAALALGRLGHLLGEKRYLDASAATLRMLTPLMRESAAPYGSALLAVDEYVNPVQNIIIRHEGDDAPGEWLDVLDAHPSPSRIVMCIPDTARALPGMLAERTHRGATTAYVCHGFQCDAPVTDVADFARTLGNYTTVATQK